MDEKTYFEKVASYKLLAKKEVGQNFLIDPEAASSIVSSLDIQKGDKVLEIGCGAGSLTYFLSLTEADVIAIDIDEAMLAKTGEDFKDCPNVSIQYGNAAKYDYTPFDKILGNLPYYITTLILERVLLTAAKAKTMAFMVQKEAGERILSKVGSKDYSPLAILLSLCYEVRKIRSVPRSSFVPAPHVDSAVYLVKRKVGISLDEAEGVYLLAKSLFLQRRKTLRNNLKGILQDETKIDEILTSLSLPSTIRPEEAKPEDYLALYRLLHQ